MFLPYNRMVVGQPLHYHYPYSASLSEVYFPLVAPMEPEDYPMITSPSNSTQVSHSLFQSNKKLIIGM